MNHTKRPRSSDAERGSPGRSPRGGSRPREAGLANIRLYLFGGAFFGEPLRVSPKNASTIVTTSLAKIGALSKTESQARRLMARARTI